MAIGRGGVRKKKMLGGLCSFGRENRRWGVLRSSALEDDGSSIFGEKIGSKISIGPVVKASREAHRRCRQSRLRTGCCFCILASKIL